MSLSDLEIKKATLKWVNKIRRENGKGNLPRLRKGRHSCVNCPITNSLHDCFPGKIVSTRRSAILVLVKDRTEVTKEFILPNEVMAFLDRFDKAYVYPELELWV